MLKALYCVLKGDGVPFTHTNYGFFQGFCILKRLEVCTTKVWFLFLKHGMFLTVKLSQTGYFRFITGYCKKKRQLQSTKH